jgi:hypothetical protein
MKFEGFYTKKQLEKRGWTIRMFRDHLPQPHKKVANPYYPDGHPMGLYDRKIVENRILSSFPGLHALDAGNIPPQDARGCRRTQRTPRASTGRG